MEREVGLERRTEVRGQALAACRVQRMLIDGGPALFLEAFRLCFEAGADAFAPL